MKTRSLLDPAPKEELEGYTAFFEGIPRKDNPYKQGSEQYKDWDDGWCNGSAED